MGKLDWSAGTVSGKVGGMIFTSWKEIPTVKGYAKPKNPKTEAQTEHRLRWAQLCAVSKALNKTWFPYVFPQDRKTTLYAQFMKYNKEYFNREIPSPMWNLPATLSLVGSSQSSLVRSEYSVTLTNYRYDASAFGVPVRSLIVFWFPDIPYCAHTVVSSYPTTFSIYFPFSAIGQRYRFRFQHCFETGIAVETISDWGTYATN